VLVSCTGGEEGDVLNPAMDRPEVRARLPEIRLEELRRAAEIIGYDEVVLLGYRDSGMPDTPANEDPRSFAKAPLEEVVGRLVEEIRRVRPQVVVTYGDERGYRHPDHLRVHEATVVAFDRAGDPHAYPEAGAPWQPEKLYYTVWSRARMWATHQKFLELGMESPFDPERLGPPEPDDEVTARIDISEQSDVAREALLAHATQVDPTWRGWFGLPPEVARTVHPYDEYTLAKVAGAARSRLGADGDGRQQNGADGALEHDLFAGVGAEPH
jgi:mycothiol S-conjugate amidase